MSQEQAKQFVDQAVQSIQGGQFAQALELLNQAVELHPENSDAHVLKGVALSQLKQPDAAVEAFRKAIMLSPYNVKAYFNLAVHYYGVGEKLRAEEMAREAVRVDPRHAGARDLLNRIESERTPTEVGVRTTEPDPQHPSDPAVTPPPGTEYPPKAEVPRPTETPSPSAPPSMGAPPLGTGMAPPPGSAGSSPGGYVPPAGTAPGGYYRPGYEHPQVHSLNFVENMGAGWTKAGWGLAIVGTIIFVISFIMTIAMWGTIMSSANQPPDFSSMFGGNALTMVLSLVGWLVQIATLVWMVLELADRRGNWMWMLPFTLCCCCGLQGPVVMIYLLKGRE
ncbi:MAG: tetratricopeptide repeat protein [Fimbriimonadaceae bacterium]